MRVQLLLSLNAYLPDRCLRRCAQGAARSELTCRRLRYAIVALAILALGGCNAWSLPGGQALRRDDQATQDAIRAAAKDPFPSAAQMGLSQTKS